MLQMIAQALATHPLARARFVATVARFQIPRLIAFHVPLLKFDLESANEATIWRPDRGPQTVDRQTSGRPNATLWRSAVDGRQSREAESLSNRECVR